MALRADSQDGESRLDAVHSAHHHIADQHMRGRLSGGLEGLFAAVNRNRTVSALVEDQGQRIGNDPLVVRNQDVPRACKGTSHKLLGSQLLLGI